jgi:glycosyltransferase involved in cell wall biosynthesis
MLLLRAVRSVLGQTVLGIEIIVVIDGPDESTEEALSTIADSRIHVVALAEAVGGAEARNVGVRAASAPWVAFLDDDDEWLPTKTARQLEVAESCQEPYPILYSRYIGRSENGDKVMAARLPAPGEPVSEYLFCRKGLRFGETGLATSELLTRTQLILEVPFSSGLRKHQDWDWVLRAVQVPGVKLYVLPDLLAVYYMYGTDQRLSNNSDWQFSVKWARDRDSLFTPKAYSYFLATECITRARKADAGAAVYFTLLRELLFRGSPRFGSIFLFLGFAFVPVGLKESLRRLFAR